MFLSKKYTWTPQNNTQFTSTPHFYLDNHPWKLILCYTYNKYYISIHYDGSSFFDIQTFLTLQISLKEEFDNKLEANSSSNTSSNISSNSNNPTTISSINPTKQQNTISLFHTHSFNRFDTDFGLFTPTFPINITLTIYLLKTPYNSFKYTSFTGIKNLGGTCYINTLLQTLFHIPEYRNMILSLGYSNSDSRDNMLDGSSSNNNSNMLDGSSSNMIDGSSKDKLLNNNNDKINNNKDTINNNNDKINNTTTTTPTPPTTTPLLYLQHLFYQLLTHTDIQIKPFIIKSNIFTDTNTHQDIHEYSKIFFDFLEKEYKGSGGCGSNSSSSNSSSSNNIRDIRDIRDTNNNPNTTTDNNNPNTTNNTTTDNNNNPTTTNNNNPSNNNNTTTNNNNPNTTNNNTTNNNNNPPPNTTITPTNNNNTPSTNPNNIIDGLLLNYIHCIDCNCKSTNKEHFQDLQVDIRDYNNNNISNTLNNSLKILFNKEILEGNNMYKCNIHGHVRAIKGMCLYKGPSVLFILIKRFNIDYETGEGYKINDYFEYPEVLEMVEGEGGGVGGEGEGGLDGLDGDVLSGSMDGSNKDIRDTRDNTTDNIRDTRDNIRDTRDNTTDNIRDNNTTTLTYNLHSVVVHSGTAHDGHYTAIINIKGNYYKFNDTIVTPVCKEEALECNYGGVHPYKNKVRVSNAYMLVYRRVGDMEGGDIGLDNFIDNSSIRDMGDSNRDIRDKDIDTNPNPNKCINTNPNPNKCINTNPNPNKCINTNPNPNKCINTNPNPTKYINTNPNPNKCINTNPNPTINTNPTTITYPNTTPTIPLPIKYPIPTTTLHPLLLSTFKKEFKDKIIYIFFKPINIGIKGNIIIIRLKMEDDYREKVREIYGVYRKYLYMFEVSNSDSVVGDVGMYNDIDNNLVGMDNNIGNIDNNIVNSNTLGNSNIDNINIGNNIGNSNIDNNIDSNTDNSNINSNIDSNTDNNIDNIDNINKSNTLGNINNTTTYPTLSYTTTVKDKGIYFAYLSDNEYNFNNNKDYLLFTKKYKEIPLCKYNNKGVLIDCEVKVIRRDMIGGVNNSSILEGVNNSSKEEGVSNSGSYKGVNNSSILEGVNNRDILEGVNNSSKEEGVKDKSSSYKGVSKSSKEEGVNNVSNVQQGVNSSSNIQQGVNNVSNVQQGVNNSSNIQQGVNNSSNIQQGVNNSSKEEGVNNSSNIQQGVNNSSKEEGVNKNNIEQHPVNNNNIEQHPVNNSTTVQHPFTNTNIFIEHQSISYVIYIYGDKEKIKKYLEYYRRGKEVELEYIDSNIDSNDNSNIGSIEKYICYGRKGKANIKIKYFIRDRDRDSSIRDRDSSVRDSDKYSSISDRDNSKYIKTKDKETNEYKDKETNEYNNKYNIYNTLNDLKMYLCCDKVRLLDGKVIIPKGYWLIKVFINNEEGYNINRVRHKHIMCVKRGVKVKEFIESVKRVGIECGVIRSIMGSDKGSKDMLEGVSDIGKEEGVSNSGSSYKGVSNSGSSYKGVSDSSKEEGVSNSGSSYEGVSNSSSSYKGVSDSSKEEGVSNSGSSYKGVSNSGSSYKGVSDSSSSYKGVSDSSNKQHPVNNNTDTQHPVINNTLYPVNNNTLHPVRVLGVRKGCMYLKVLDGDEYVEEVMVIERCYMGRYIKGCYLRGCSVIGYCFLIPFKESERIIEFKRRMGVVSRVIRCNGEGFYVMEDNEVMEVSNEEYVMMEV